MIELLAESNNFGDTREGGLAGPTGLVIILLLAAGTIFLIRNMNARLRRLPERFESQGPELQGPELQGPEPQGPESQGRDQGDEHGPESPGSGSRGGSALPGSAAATPSKPRAEDAR